MQLSLLWTLYGLESILMHYLHLGIELATGRATCHQRNRLTAAGCKLHVAKIRAKRNSKETQLCCCCCCWYCCVICHLRPTMATPTRAQVTPTLRWNCCWSQQKICWLAQLDDYLNSEPATILLAAHTLSLSLCLWLRTMTTTTTNLGQREWERKKGREWGREGEWGQTSSSRSPSLLWAFDFKCQRCLGKLVNELTTTTNWNKIDKTRTTTTTKTTSSGCSSAAQLSASFDSLRQPVVALLLSLSLTLSVTPLLRSQCCRR